jgi:predicted PurR-regulated permease PerM
VPLALSFLIGGNLPLALCLILVQAVCFLVRQILEPKLISNQVGVHPLVTIASVYVGMRLMGAAGLILLPITVFVTINVYGAYLKNKRESRRTSFDLGENFAPEFYSKDSLLKLDLADPRPIIPDDAEDKK